MEATAIIVLVTFVLIVSAGFYTVMDDKTYNRIYNRDEWNAWKKVIEDIDVLTPEPPEYGGRRLCKFDSDGNLEYYVYRFLDDDDLGIFNKKDSCIGTRFDKYHHDIVKKMLDEKYPLNNG